MVLVETKMEGKSVADWLSRAGPVIRSGDRVSSRKRAGRPFYLGQNYSRETSSSRWKTISFGSRS